MLLLSLPLAPSLQHHSFLIRRSSLSDVSVHTCEPRGAQPLREVLVLECSSLRFLRFFFKPFYTFALARRVSRLVFPGGKDLLTCKTEMEITELRSTFTS